MCIVSRLNGQTKKEVVEYTIELCVCCHWNVNNRLGTQSDQFAEFSLSIAQTQQCYKVWRFSYNRWLFFITTNKANRTPTHRTTTIVWCTLVFIGHCSIVEVPIFFSSFVFILFHFILDFTRNCIKHWCVALVTSERDATTANNCNLRTNAKANNWFSC